VADVWSELFKLYSSHVRARTVTTRIALATTRKNQLSIAEYYSKMQTLADNMMSIGSALRDDEFVSYILTGLDEDYNAVYSVVITRVEPITPANCMHSSSAMSSTYNYSTAVLLATLHLPTRLLAAAVCHAVVLVDHHVAEAATGLAVHHALTSQTPRPAPTPILSAKYASR
jgi:hypothetical protein